MDGPFWVYVLENSAGRFDIGQTDDLERRLGQHNDPSADSRKYAVKNGPWQLVWSEPHETRESAVRRERQIKSMKSARWIRENLLSW
jgi:predicted GIY-YIG superfamily endonuclease